MYMNIEQIPFSMKGSYLAISHLPAEFRGMRNSEGLYLRSIHGLSYIACCGMGDPAFARLVPLVDGKEVEYKTEMKPWELNIITAAGHISVGFGDPEVLLFKGAGERIGLRLELITGHLQELPYADELYCLLNCARNGRRFLAAAQSGRMHMEQEWNQGDPRNGSVQFTAQDGGFLSIIEDIPSEWVGRTYHYEYDACREETRREFERFRAGMSEAPAELAEAHEVASYVNWASYVSRSGILTRDAMLMSKNWMCSVWSWDHCFNAMALVGHDPAAAWDQFMLMFDYQDEKTGALPDFVNDVYKETCFTKPPIHGWALSKMMRGMALTRSQTVEAYDRLSKWTDWWLNYRDRDGDGYASIGTATIPAGITPPSFGQGRPWNCLIWRHS